MSKASDIEKLRQALDDSVLTHTGRSIGDLASQRVIDDMWPLIEAMGSDESGATMTHAYLDGLRQLGKSELVNQLYNHQIAGMADYEPNDHDPYGHSKRIPYIGWFWRDTDIVRRHICIGDSGGLIGVMENNKWDYPERELMPEEAETFIAFLERAFAERNKGGILSETTERVELVCAEMWSWFQSLRIEKS